MPDIRQELLHALSDLADQLKGQIIALEDRGHSSLEEVHVIGAVVLAIDNFFNHQYEPNASNYLNEELLRSLYPRPYDVDVRNTYVGMCKKVEAENNQDILRLYHAIQVELTNYNSVPHAQRSNANRWHFPFFAASEASPASLLNKVFQLLHRTIQQDEALNRLSNEASPSRQRGLS